MPEIKVIHDRDSDMLPSIGELQESGNRGRTGSGTNKNTGKELNSTQGHEVDIKEGVTGESLAESIHKGMMDGSASLDKLDRTNRSSWPDATQI